ncbi:ribonuclease Y [bacterium CG_4_9_14_3_um_filter_65_15]|nr:MAG: ribonuclease Y [bacterium CG_4_9_14_3_um_filter_65_15]
MPQIPPYVLPAVAACIGGLAGWLFSRRRQESLHGSAAEHNERMLEDARREAQSLLKTAQLEAKEEFLRAHQQFEEETDRLRKESRRRQEALDMREDNLDKKVTFIDQKEARLVSREEDQALRSDALARDRTDLDRLLVEQNFKLEQIAGMTAESAKRQLMENMVNEARLAAARSIHQAREEAERTSRREAIGILSLAIQRYASEHVAETTVSVVDLPGDDMKGRIIGREGRNIRAFELATGIDVIIDDTPGAVIVSGFDPVRREIARQSLEILVRDGRIHPGRIEEVVRKTTEEIQEKIREIGEQACLDIGLQNVRPELYPYLGRLDYRTSYGQNLLNHAREVAAVAGIIADELGLDSRLARRCGFLHDIGKAADHEIEGPHAMIGARLCKKYGENATVINAVGGHHQDVEATSPYTFITAAADAVSASRPGARRESLDSYVQRLENLEAIAESFPGVEKSYAIQAGREVRILVDHHQVSDAEAAVMAEEISRRVEGELEYPGQIRIMVIRETRATAVAK